MTGNKMKRYKFIIKLSDGNEIQATSVGNSVMKP